MIDPCAVNFWLIVLISATCLVPITYIPSVLIDFHPRKTSGCVELKKLLQSLVYYGPWNIQQPWEFYPSVLAIDNILQFHCLHDEFAHYAADEWKIRIFEPMRQRLGRYTADHPSVCRSWWECELRSKSDAVFGRSLFVSLTEIVKFTGQLKNRFFRAFLECNFQLTYVITKIMESLWTFPWDHFWRHHHYTQLQNILICTIDVYKIFKLERWKRRTILYFTSTQYNSREREIDGRRYLSFLSL